ncbi:hypothetical protein EVAR_80493_1 [Eumeta japonica]|uniref:Uncharacterized protein n=1 Tax=Eumeta variegata TaxID=151549 RepID=A0A4C1ZFX7_EUMVA|nr:hypothetical protein EVAR_80493_1 [Eumeta japonica]
MLKLGDICTRPKSRSRKGRGRGPSGGRRLETGQEAARASLDPGGGAVGDKKNSTGSIQAAKCTRDRVTVNPPRHAAPAPPRPANARARVSAGRFMLRSCPL